MKNFFSFFDKKIESKKNFINSPKNSTPKVFTTQNKMIEDHNIHIRNGSGLCIELANAWLKERLQGKEARFLKSDKNTAEEVMHLVERQNLMKDVGKSQDQIANIAFEETNTPYETEIVAEEVVTNPKNFTKNMEHSSFALITYPSVFGGKHTVGFENDINKKEKCRFFDANFTGGEKKGSCPEIINILTENISFMHEPHAPSTISRSS